MSMILSVLAGTIYMDLHARLRDLRVGKPRAVSVAKCKATDIILERFYEKDYSAPSPSPTVSVNEFLKAILINGVAGEIASMRSTRYELESWQHNDFEHGLDLMTRVLHRIIVLDTTLASQSSPVFVSIDVYDSLVTDVGIDDKVMEEVLTTTLWTIYRGNSIDEHVYGPIAYNMIREILKPGYDLRSVITMPCYDFAYVDGKLTLTLGYGFTDGMLAEL